MTVRKSVLQGERQDRRTTIHDAQQQTMNTLVAPTTTTKQSTTSHMTMSMSPKKDTVRGRSSPSKTPVLLADGRIVKKELKGIMGRLDKSHPFVACTFDFIQTFTILFYQMVKSIYNFCHFKITIVDICSCVPQMRSDDIIDVCFLSEIEVLFCISCLPTVHPNASSAILFTFS